MCVSLSCKFQYLGPNGLSDAPKTTLLLAGSIMQELHANAKDPFTLVLQTEKHAQINY